jgi:hypothetical protein
VPFSDPPISCGTPFWPPNCLWLVAVLLQGNVVLHFDLFFTAYFNGGWWGERGKFVEIDDSCFSRWKHNCSRLHATAWIFVGVEWESGIPVADCSAETLLTFKACIVRSTIIVSDCWGYNIRLCDDGLTTPSIAVWLSWNLDVQIRSSPHGCTSRLTSGLTEKTKLNVW